MKIEFTKNASQKSDEVAIWDQFPLRAVSIHVMHQPLHSDHVVQVPQSKQAQCTCIQDPELFPTQVEIMGSE